MKLDEDIQFFVIFENRSDLNGLNRAHDVSNRFTFISDEYAILLLDIEFVAAKEECKGSYTRDCDYSSVEQCALGCANVSSMFVFGLAGTYSCVAGNCQCHCALSATANGSCEQTSHNAFDLYRIKSSAIPAVPVGEPKSKYVYQNLFLSS